MTPAARRLRLVVLAPRPVAVEIGARPALTVPPRSRLRPALNLVLWLALVVVGLAAFTSLPE